MLLVEPRPPKSLSRSLMAVVLLLGLMPSNASALPMPGDGAPSNVGVVENSGANRLSLPIPLPPATGGFAPTLALVYASDRGNGPFGFGWNLQFGEIRRSFRSGIPSMNDPNDQFELDGQPLVTNPSESTATRTRYHTITESYIRLFHIVENGQDFWEATQRDGTVLRFGLDSTSRVLRDGASGPVTRWLIREMESPNGNVILFDHLIENGADYPQKVRFTYRGTPRVPVGTLRQVEFLYTTTRADPSFTFMGSASRSLTRRVSQVVVTVGSTIYRRMQLVYADEPGAGKAYSTGLSRLASVQMFGVGGTESLPAQRFEYSDLADAVGAGSNWQTAAFNLPTSSSLIGSNGEDRGVRFGDINGDGLLDMIRAYEDASGNVSQKVWLRTTSGWSSSDSLASDMPTSTPVGKKIRFTFVQSGGSLALSSVTLSSIANPALFASSRNPRFVQPNANDPLTLDYYPGPSWQLTDIDGDGRADLVGGYTIAAADPSCAGLVPTTQVHEVYINDGNGWSRGNARSDALPPPRSIAIACSVPSNPQSAILVSPDAQIADLDGDHVADLIFPGTDPRLANAGKVFLSKGSTFTEKPSQQLLFSGSSTLADINRDGLADILVSTTQDHTVFLNTGNGWCSSAQATPCGAFAARYALPGVFAPRQAYLSLQLVDVDGDGWLDAVRQDPAAPSAAGQAWRHDPAAPAGSVWVSDSRFAPPKGAALLDVDFDGDTDLVDLAHTQDYAGKSRFLGLLTRFENGLGGIVGYAYESAVKQQDPNFNSRTAIYIGGPVSAFWTTSPVLLARSFSGVDVTPFTQSYLYAQPVFLSDWGMSQGFIGVQVSGPSTTSVVSYFAPQAPLSGVVLSREVLEGNFLGSVISRETNVYEILEGDDPNAGPGSTADAFVARRTQRERSSQWAGAATFTETYSYSPSAGDQYWGYGFMTQLTTARPTEAVVVTRKLAPPDTTKWILGRPEQVIVTKATSQNAIEISKERFSYDEFGHLATTTAYEGARGNLSAATPRVTTHTYDQFGNLRSQTDPAGRVVEICYDGDATFPSGSSCNSLTSQATHSASVAFLDSLGQVTAEAPDPITGDVTETLLAFSGDREKQTYDSFGRPLQSFFQPSGQSDILLSETHYVDFASSPIGQAFVETFGAIASGTTASVRSARYLDGFAREVRSVSDAPSVGGAPRYFGVATRIDPALRQITKTYPAACASGGTDPHCVGLFNGTQPRSVELQDGLGRPLSVTLPTGKTRFHYKTGTRTHPDTGPSYFDTALTVDAAGYAVRRWYDGDRLIFVEECSSGPISESANLANVTCDEDAVSFYRYEPGGQAVDIYGSNTSSWNDPNKAVTHSVFDSLGRTVEQRDLNKSASEFFVYDSAGRVQRRTNARGQQIEFAYDPLDRLTQVTYPSAFGTRRYAITYDNRTGLEQTIEQRQIAPSDSLLSLESIGYDALGRRNRRGLQIGTRSTLVTEVDSDLLGRPTQIRTPDLGTVLSYEYEGAYLRRVCELGSAQNCTSSGAQAYLSNVEYDAIGRETGIVGAVSGGAAAPRMDVSYDPNTFRLNRLNFVPTQGTGVERLDLTYTFDSRDNVTAIVDGSVNSGVSDVPYGVSYTYDRRSRLTKRVRGSDTKFFTYNTYGNLTGKSVSSSGGTNQTYDSARSHRIVSGAGLSFGYDADGNVTARGTQRFIYDAMQRMECSGTTTAACPEPFLYGVDGSRLASDGGTTPPRVFAAELFDWEPSTGAGTVRVDALGRQIAYKRIPTVSLRTGIDLIGVPIERFAPWVLNLLGSGALLAVLAWLISGGMISGVRARPVYAALTGLLVTFTVLPPSLSWAITLPTNQGVYRRWVWEDPLGSGVHITDELGNMKHQRSFEPFGEIAKENSNEVTERTFAEHRFEDGPGLYYMNARWYDPAVGRFHSVDPVIHPAAPQSLNAYSYVQNNPTSRRDPSGLDGEGFGIYNGCFDVNFNYNSIYYSSQKTQDALAFLGIFTKQARSGAFGSVFGPLSSPGLPGDPGPGPVFSTTTFSLTGGEEAAAAAVLIANPEIVPILLAATVGAAVVAAAVVAVIVLEPYVSPAVADAIKAYEEFAKARVEPKAVPIPRDKTGDDERKKPFAVRLQAQGGGVEKSVPLAASRPITAAEGLAGLEALKAKLTKDQLRDRALSFRQAERFIGNAAAGGGVGPTKRSFYGEGSIRVDIEVISGVNFVP